MRRIEPATWVVLAGVAAALHVGKLPPALPVLRDALGITLLEAGFALSLVQLAGMTLGLAVGLAADALGLRRTLLCGLSVLACASILGGWAREPWQLLSLRAFEGLGFLLASMPAPGLIRRLVTPARLNAALGAWGAYMPLGTALSLLLGPAVITVAGWQALWWLLGVVALMAAAAVAYAVPPDGARAVMTSSTAGPQWLLRLRLTLSARACWLVALCFAAYSSQWLAVIGFLPSVYADAGWAGTAAAFATALVAAVNMIGNIASGRLLQRGVAPSTLLGWGFAAMGVGAVVAFAPLQGLSGPGVTALRYGAVVAFSMLGGMIPGTLFSLAVRVAPGEGTVSTTVGWMQQWSSLGQFAGPPLVAWLAVHAGGWQWTWAATGTCSIIGLVLAGAIARLLRGARP
ncbi:MAG: MFS transporter [Burkholderiales bacterium]|nr:MFS transporter [Burkholderiales bacterium]